MNKFPIKGMSEVISFIANVFAVATILALILRQDDQLLIFFILFAIAALGFVYYLFREIIHRGIILVLGGSLALLVVAALLLINADVTPVQVKIIDPPDGGSVTSMQYPVEGRVSDWNASVYLIARRQAESEMSVQQIPIVSGEGKWQALAAFGTEATGIGEQYEIIAFATNDNILVTWVTGNSVAERQKLQSLPRKTNKSNLNTVTRAVPSSADEMIRAFDALNKRDYEKAIEIAKNCIRNFKSGADEVQARLEAAQTSMYPVGKPSDEALKEEILSNGVLNDVAACSWVQARAYHENVALKQAKEAYLATARYTYARVYDPRTDIFWSPANDAKQRVKQIP